MVVDCAIIGGGPAGLNAALVLGRARRSVLVFDDNQPRNAVTHESHGFLTRDGVAPGEFRELGRREIGKYPSVALWQARITSVSSQEGVFALVGDDGAAAQAHTIILATGLRESLPAIPGIHDYYGTSLFSCPYCDGWELRDKPLVVIAEDGQRAFHMAKVVWNWSRDLLLCANGHTILSAEQKSTLLRNGIRVVEDAITALVGTNGALERVVFASGEDSAREGGFVVSPLSQASDVAARLGCEMNAQGNIVIDELGRTSVPGVYAAGDAAGMAPAQLVIAAAAGSRAAAGVNMDLIDRAFL